jgi:hypothetical protein
MAVNWKVAVFGGLGASALLYAALRAPRHLYDGEVEACEGSGSDCESLILRRGSGSGKLFAPFNGELVVMPVGQTVSLRLQTDVLMMVFQVPAGAPIGAPGPVRAGAMLAQSDRVKVHSLYQTKPLATSAWLVANGFAPSSKRGSSWCEDRSHLIVPKCPGVTFTRPPLPKLSLRTISVEQ